MDWMGQPIEDLSRDELIGVVRDLARELYAEREHHGRTLDVFAYPPVGSPERRAMQQAENAFIKSVLDAMPLVTPS